MEVFGSGLTPDPDDYEYWRRWYLAEWATWQALSDLGMCPQADADLAHDLYLVHCKLDPRNEP